MNIRPPHALLALTDAPRALGDIAVLAAASPLLHLMPKASEPRSVMVIPGFFGDDKGNTPLLRFLRRLGYTASGWGQGRNLGPGSFTEEDLEQVAEPLRAAGGGKVTLIGHSLGGIYAREIARANPEQIEQVITLGSPFGHGRDQASHANRLYQRLNPQPDVRDNDDQLCTPPPVPTTAIYTRGDGIVNWRTSLQPGTDHHVHNIEVPGSHIGLNLNIVVWHWIAKKLAKATSVNA